MAKEVNKQGDIKELRLKPIKTLSAQKIAAELFKVSEATVSRAQRGETNHPEIRKVIERYREHQLKFIKEEKKRLKSK